MTLVIVSAPRVEERAELPAGFRAGGLSAGIKASGRPDLGVVVVAGPEAATAAAVFTANLVQAAPVRMSRRHLEQTSGRVRALIVTSGCANAATGPAGDEDQTAIAEALATTFGIDGVETVAASTGLIGTRLPVDRVREGLTLLAAEGMRTDAGGWEAFGTAIMTTDSRRKAATTTIALPTDDLSLRLVRVSGVAKGVGMIHPGWRP